MTTESLCVFCKHWRFDGGEEGYSELTPAYSASMDCAKGHYGKNFTLHSINETQFREYILHAKKCSDYHCVKEET